MISILMRNDRGQYICNSDGKFYFMDRSQSESIPDASIVEATVTKEFPTYGFFTCTSIATDSLEASASINEFLDDPYDYYVRDNAVIMVSRNTTDKYVCIDGKVYSLPYINVSYFTLNGYKHVNIDPKVVIKLLINSSPAISFENRSFMQAFVNMLGILWHNFPDHIYTINDRLWVIPTIHENVVYKSNMKVLCRIDSLKDLPFNVVDVTDKVKEFLYVNHISMNRIVTIPAALGSDIGYLRLRHAASFDFERDDSDWDTYMNMRESLCKRLTAKTVSQYADFVNIKKVLGLL